MKSAHKTWFNKYREFSTRTSLHGFNELYIAKNHAGKLFWVISLTLCLTIMVYQLTLTFQQFVNEPYVTVIEKLKPEHMVYANVSLCYRHWVYWVDFNKAFKLGFTKASTLYGLSYLTPIYSETKFNVTQAERHFVSTMTLHNFTKISDFYKAIAKNQPHADFTELEPHGINMFCYESITENVLKKLNPDGDYPKKETFVHYDIKQEEFYQLPLNQISSSEYNCYVAKYLQERMGASVDNILGEGGDSGENPPLLTTHFLSGKGVTEIGHDNNYLEIAMTATVSKTQNTRQSPCHAASTSREACEQKCSYDEYSFKYCSCYPMAVYTMKMDLDSLKWLCRNEITFFTRFSGCKDSILSDPKSIETPLNTRCLRCKIDADTSGGVCCNGSAEKAAAAVTKCKSSCSPPCTKWVHNFGFINKQEDAKYMKKDNYSTTIFVTFPSTESILFMNEIENRSLERLFGNIGGLLGIWLGGSVLSFLQLSYLCCCNEFRNFYKNRLSGKRHHHDSNQNTRQFSTTMENEKV